ncbi:hypothetical protein ACWGH8_19005 [Nonomuraea muscovyensis]|uniref:Peptidoglycan/LPS O-acetylase OafA/YrhL n=1 Tax=Nonomuraea muscovyensis TaxID=1124761 RepID=A0A7X0CBQ2_9ACTN|nr:hypothetical protein [Nonomuraea muscovyensis]MBB6351728.1 peptidoglycan/LPS O-acetylase OafA/YrhL [Nonomuraea muscovyensis]
MAPLAVETARPNRWFQVGRGLLILAALAAAAAGAGAIGEVAGAGPEALIAQTWRMYGLFLCAGLFGVLAWRPDTHVSVWTLLIANKAALTVTAVAYLAAGGAPGAAETAAWDGALTAVLVLAFLTTRRRTSG